MSLEHRVELESAKKRYRLLQGNKAVNSTVWKTVVYDWTNVPPSVYIDANIEAIHLNPTGTANSGTISIQDDARDTKYRVVIACTGRIRIPTVF